MCMCFFSSPEIPPVPKAPKPYIPPEAPIAPVTAQGNKAQFDTKRTRGSRSNIKTSSRGLLEKEQIGKNFIRGISG